MNCDECLTIVEQAPVAELAENTAVREHGATCAECSRVITLVIDGERSLATSLDRQASTVSAIHTAETAVATARRRRSARLLAGVVAIAIAIAAWAAVVQVIVPGIRTTTTLVRGTQQTETIALQCLSPTQAGDLISPYVRSSGSVYYPAKPPLRLITVRATAEELQKVRALLKQFDGADGSQCPIPTAPSGPLPSH
jgi:hypothetical protein